jgi:hypothetical protein
VLWRTGRRELGRAPKSALAEQLVSLIAEILAERASSAERGTAQA